MSNNVRDENLIKNQLSKTKIIEKPITTELKIRNNSEHIDTFTLFNRYGALPLWIWLAILILLIIVTFILYRLSRRRDRKITQRRNSQKETDAHDEHKD